MPTYEYLCKAGHAFELFQRMSDPPAGECPRCGGEASRKITGGSGFLFKGDGFYITDYRSEEYRRKAKSESGEVGGEVGGGSGAAKASEKNGKRAGKSEKSEIATSSGDAGGDGKGSGDS
ncbi:MAG: zinc ribbon domain-containing protein [Gemmatimonadetes bacterium]|nr:zinc ribbon domain-containing protein [Gemmatimonadota bacterium]